MHSFFKIIRVYVVAALFGVCYAWRHEAQHFRVQMPNSYCSINKLKTRFKITTAVTVTMCVFQK